MKGPRAECYVAKHQGRMVAGFWCRDDRFYDRYLARHIEIAAHEIYYLAGFTAPAFRGHGIWPYLAAQMSRAIVARDSRKTRALIFVQVANRASLRSLAKVQASPAGWVGFVELFGVRLHYLWGRNLLPKTERRFFAERV
jgi:GNAT superfamily N-acetyltransferase